jgi:hypothetical protein
MMPNFGFQPGVLDYWMLLADWRNGSFAILLALGVLLVGFALAIRNRMLTAEGLGVAQGIDECAAPSSTPGEKPTPVASGAP